MADDDEKDDREDSKRSVLRLGMNPVPPPDAEALRRRREDLRKRAEKHARKSELANLARMNETAELQGRVIRDQQRRDQLQQEQAALTKEQVEIMVEIGGDVSDLKDGAKTSFWLEVVAAIAACIAAAAASFTVWVQIWG